MNEIDWLDELYTVCSLPSIDILKFLWSQHHPVDTHFISQGTHMSMEEVYQHLKSLENEGVVKLIGVKTKNEDRRLWIPNLDSFTILIKAERGNFTYKSNIKQKSLKILDTIPEKTSRKELNYEKATKAIPTTKIRIKHKNANIELEGSENFVEKRWKEFKPYVNQSSVTIKKLPGKKLEKIRKTKTNKKKLIQ